MAVGALAMQVPATVQADEMDEAWKEWVDKLPCKGYSDKHVKNPQVTTSNGQITVTMEFEFSKEANKESTSCNIYVLEEKLNQGAVEDGNNTYYDCSEVSSKCKDKGCECLTEAKNTCTFKGLTSGKPYYLYYNVHDSHSGEGEADLFEHYAVYLESVTLTAGSSSSSASSSSSFSGSSSSSSNNSKSAWASYEEKVSNQIEAAPSGSTIVMEKGVSALSNSMMKELLEKGDVSLKLEFTYNNVEYVIIIPAGAALDNDIPWYGPLYLAQQFGNSVGGAAPAAVKAGGAYEVKSGDSMNKIATANNMTLTQLLTKNPQIKDPNKIAVGQKINL